MSSPSRSRGEFYTLGATQDQIINYEGPDEDHLYLPSNKKLAGLDDHDPARVRSLNNFPATKNQRFQHDKYMLVDEGNGTFQLGWKTQYTRNHESIDDYPLLDIGDKLTVTDKETGEVIKFRVDEIFQRNSKNRSKKAQASLATMRVKLVKMTR